MAASLMIYGAALFCIFKFSKSELLEVIGILVLTILCKVIIGNGSFYPLFCMPVLLGLRYKKPYGVLYTIIMITFVNIVYGFGIWAIGQYAIYGIICLLTYFIRNILNKQNKLVVFGYSFITMFMFGVLMDVFSFYTGNFFGYSNVFQQIVAGLPFDLKYGLSGITFGGISLIIAYMSSVEIKDILKINKMKLEKVCI